MAAEGTPGLRRISRKGAGGGLLDRLLSCAAGCLELESDSPGIRTDEQRDDNPDDRHRRCSEPRHDEGVQLEVLTCKQGRKTRGSSAAPKSAPNKTYEIARARRSGGYMSAAAVRASRTLPLIAPTRETEDDEWGVVGRAAERCETQPTAPIPNPPAMTGTRPN